MTRQECVLKSRLNPFSPTDTPDTTHYRPSTSVVVSISNRIFREYARYYLTGDQGLKQNTVQTITAISLRSVAGVSAKTT